MRERSSNTRILQSAPENTVRPILSGIVTATEAAGLAAKAEPLLKDPKEIVRVRAAEFLGRIGKINPQTDLTEILNTTEDPIVATEALNSVVWFRDFFDGKYPVKRSDFTRNMRGADVDDRLNYINGQPYPKKASKPGKKKKKP